MKKLSVMSGGVLVALVAVLWPRDAHAWGPLAHMSFASGALSDLSLFSPAVRMILSNFTGEFLYGGLAADTVAHNYYVPYKTVQGFRIRAANHAYWEIRYDQKLPSDLWQLGQKVCGREYREHDAHLEDCLSESYVIPFSISKRLFGSILLAARLKKWQTLSRVLAGDDYSLHTEEVHECRKLAVEQIVGMLKHGRDARCVTADPTGGRNLHHANQLRLQLKDAKLPEKNANEVVRKARPAFREAIHGRLNMPVVYS